MTYTERVKASKIIRQAILNLVEGEVMEVMYEGKKYTIQCYDTASGRKDSKLYAITNDLYRSMNVSHITNTTLKCYAFDMMTQKTTYNFPLWHLRTGLHFNN